MTEHLLAEFLTVALVHAVAVASPGPDFAIVLRHSVRYGRNTAAITSLGVGSGIFWHVLISLAGIGLLLYSMPMAVDLLTWVAAAYLIYLGWQGITSGAGQRDNELNGQATDQPKAKTAFMIGFLTNGLNPKATLFFISLYAVVVQPETEWAIRLGYGVYMAIATAAWFVGLSFLLGSNKVRGFMLSKGYWFDRLTGAVLVGLALKLVIQ